MASDAFEVCNDMTRFFLLFVDQSLAAELHDSFHVFCEVHVLISPCRTSGFDFQGL